MQICALCLRSQNLVFGLFRAIPNFQPVALLPFFFYNALDLSWSPYRERVWRLYANDRGVVEYFLGRVEQLWHPVLAGWRARKPEQEARVRLRRPNSSSCRHWQLYIWSGTITFKALCTGLEDFVIYYILTYFTSLCVKPRGSVAAN